MPEDNFFFTLDLDLRKHRTGRYRSEGSSRRGDDSAGGAGPIPGASRSSQQLTGGDLQGPRPSEIRGRAGSRRDRGGRWDRGRPPETEAERDRGRIEAAGGTGGDLQRPRPSGIRARGRVSALAIQRARGGDGRLKAPG
jgi:hypothetical protein